MIDEANQTNNTQNPTTTVVPEAMASSTNAEGVELQAATESDSQVATAETSTGTEVEAETDQTAEQEAMALAIAALKQQVESLKAQVEDRTSQYMRIAADFDNFRKRTAKEKEELEQQAKCATILEILPVVDNFERARGQLKPQTDGEMTIHKSYQSVYKQLVDCLKRLGVSPMRPKGKEFDPNLHDAVMREPTDEYPEGTVTEELMPGYFLGEKVLRHAMVKVAAANEGVVTSEENQPE
ncbi:nucleotide exchange factor GrpE [Microseira sp. BLCC-F43]|jgi:molecular chaperone GrpE|uniref:nucleotide exchange factor GrpE n=1 Tax=Microseira sp. BLCC-F43 TaxID=3153602 RepID=UPI0035BA5E36